MLPLLQALPSSILSFALRQVHESPWQDVQPGIEMAIFSVYKWVLLSWFGGQNEGGRDESSHSLPLSLDMALPTKQTSP